MKKIVKRVTLMLAVVSSICALSTSCTPEEVDAFAKGYRDGYYGTYGGYGTSACAAGEVVVEASEETPNNE